MNERFVEFVYYMRVVVFLGLITLLQAISLSVSSMKERCMIVSSNNNEHFLKADLTFRRFEDQNIEEGYRIVLHNTETHDEQAYQISEGSFRKEFQLTEHIVYRFCFKIVLTKQRDIRAIMEYNADLKHQQTTVDSEVTVPAGLLKIEDLKKTYQTMSHMENFVKEVKDNAPRVQQEDELAFQSQKDRMDTLALISAVEIGVVVVFGFYQYFRLKGLIEAKY